MDIRPALALLTLCFLLGLLGLLGCDDEIQLGVCGSPCYLGPEGTANLGECRTGTVTCDAAGHATGCTDRRPGTEICDGLDEDCDGTVDDQPADVGAGCGLGLRGVCAQSRLHCALGQRVCLPPLGFPRPETCDGLDEDCDGRTDNIPPELCYSGPPETAARAPCRAGIMACDQGTIVCRDEVTPEYDLCGDGLDQDCDGFTDNPDPEDRHPVDRVVIVDRSGSMGPDMPGIKAALRVLVTAPPEDTTRLIDLPGGASANWAPNVTCHPDRTLTYPCVALELAIDWLDDTHGGFEASLDVLSDLATGRAGVPWRPGADRYVVLLTDEPPQSRDVTRTATSVKQDIQNAGLVVIIFADAEIQAFAPLVETDPRSQLLPLREANLETVLPAAITPRCQ